MKLIPAFRRLALFAALALLPNSAPAQPAATVPADDGSAIVTPYLDNQTLAVIHLDTAAIDVAGLETYARSLLEAGGAKPTEFDTQFTIARAFLNKNLAAFHKAGGRHAYALFSHADIWLMQQPKAILMPVAVLLPVEAGSDAKTLTDMLTPFAALGDLKLAPLNDKLLFLGQAETLKHLQAIKPQPRPDLLRAMAYGKAFPLHAVMALTPDTRRAVAEIMPTFPAEIGGGSTEVFTRDLEAVSIGIWAKPPQITLSMLMKDPGGAVLNGPVPESAKMQQALTQLLDQLKQNHDVIDAIKAGDARGKALGEFINSLSFSSPFTVNMTLGAGSLLAAPSKQVDLTLGDKQFRLIAQMLVPELQQETGGMPQRASITNVRQLLVGVIDHMSANNGAMPDSLDVVVTENKFPRDIVLSPAKRSVYAYRVWTPAQLKRLDPPATPIVFEVIDAPDASLVVGYLDGHVAAQVAASTLNDQLRAAEKRADTP